MEFIIFLQSNEPLAWANNLLEQKSPVLNSVDTFFDAMVQLYDDPQHRTTVEDFTSGLQIRDGTRHLKDELARVETHSTIEGLIQLAIQLDRSLRKQRSEHSST